MKKIILNLFVLSALVLTTSCSSDDDKGGSDASQQLVLTVDGQTLTFDSIIVDEDTYTDDDGMQYTDLYVTAIIGGDTNRVIEFDLEAGDTGANAVYYFEYTVDGVSYTYNFDSNFNIVVSVNNGSNITATFAGELSGYNFETEEQESITIENGSVSVDY